MVRSQKEPEREEFGMMVIRFDDAACRRIRSLLDSYIDNQLSVETSQELTRHLERCDSCTDEMAERLRLKKAVRAAVGAIPVPAGLEEQVRRRVRREVSGGMFGLGRFPLAVAAVVLVGLIVASLVVLDRTGLWMDPKERRESYIESIYQRVNGLARLGFGDHVHCAHYRQFPHLPPLLPNSVADLGLGYEDLPGLLRDRVPEDFRIWLAHRCSYRGRSYVHLVLRRNNELLSLILTRRRPDECFENDQVQPALQAEGVRIYRSQVDTFELAGFETEGHLAFVVSNLPREGNLQIAQAVAPSLKRFLARARG